MYILVNLSSGGLVTHTLPSGQTAYILFDSEDQIPEYTQANPGLYKALRLTRKELSQIKTIPW